jgi:hypothetical protein
MARKQLPAPLAAGGILGETVSGMTVKGLVVRSGLRRLVCRPAVLKAMLPEL